ncbi:DUF1330 domain-containing protein [Antrihabitans sp. YC3-6]|jgi:uncharacterized protein (DUF1330 family)|uniref:DUF1330 domain-containing protein n=1 Tax=Antrihabitans stalagmiti TaxID=2799499 RepID=A0A934NWV3_9NOCA|nr:DUF1330 domain-containing protein [Antrihabitans stalagmiti]MBJ8342732.1 DUF1330 domain-containing protein [Antrihabitans stalagmiti]
MTAYAVANLTNVQLGDGIVEYLQRIDATLAPFEGKFLIHGGTPKITEGEWHGTLIVIAFPDAEHAEGWYDSAAYRDILHLRTDNSDGDAFLIEGVDADHRATDVLVTA